MKRKENLLLGGILAGAVWLMFFLRIGKYLSDLINNFAMAASTDDSFQNA